MNVPRIVSANVATSSDRFHTRSMPAPFLHEHRVDVGGRRQPRQQAGVLHRVPRPHPAPTEHGVAPPAAEEDADGEKRPREQRPPARLEQPPLADSTGDEGGDGEGERHRHADVAEVEDRRVEQHEDVVLQQRVRPRAEVATGTPLPNGLAGPKLTQGEERHDDEHHDERPGDERVGRAAGGTSTRPPPCSRRGSAARAGSSPPAPTTSRRCCTAAASSPSRPVGRRRARSRG